jgi:hypothetical protein
MATASRRELATKYKSGTDQERRQQDYNSDGRAPSRDRPVANGFLLDHAALRDDRVPQLILPPMI